MQPDIIKKEESLLGLLMNSIYGLQVATSEVVKSLFQNNQSTQLEKKSSVSLFPCYALFYTSIDKTEQLIFLLGPKGKNGEIIAILYLQKESRVHSNLRFFLTILEYESCFILILAGSKPLVVHELTFDDGDKVSWKKTKKEGGFSGAVSISYTEGQYACDIKTTHPYQENLTDFAQVGIVESIDQQGKKMTYQYPGMNYDAPKINNNTNVRREGKEILFI